MKIVSVIGKRSCFVKAAILSQALKSMDNPPFEDMLIYIGQHYDQLMSDVATECVVLENSKMPLLVNKLFSSSIITCVSLLIKGYSLLFRNLRMPFFVSNSFTPDPDFWLYN